MASNNPHMLKRPSLFALFSLSYLPLFILLTIKIALSNKGFFHFGGFSEKAIFLFLEKFGFIIMLCVLGLYGIIGTAVTMKNILKKRTNAFPVKVESIKPKNEEAISYLGSYVIPLLIKGETGFFEYATFIILFVIYYKLYSSSSLILINPILNFKYGLYEIEYTHTTGDNKIKTAKIISSQQWLDEGEELQIVKLGHKLYFAY